MINNFYKKTLEELSPEQSWEKLLYYWEEEKNQGILMPRLMKKAIEHMIAKGYNKKVYVINYSHPMLRLVATNQWSPAQAELDLLDQESRYVTGDKFPTDYLIIFSPKKSGGVTVEEMRDLDKRIKEMGFDEAAKEIREEYRKVMIKKEFNESELEAVLNEFISKLLNENTENSQK